MAHNRNHSGVFVNQGASNHSKLTRMDLDFYTTPPLATQELIRIENLPKIIPIWEPACGTLEISKVLVDNHYEVINSDIFIRPLNSDLKMIQHDFLGGDYKSIPQLQEHLDSNGKLCMNIITNPPYNLAQEFVERALDIVSPGYKVCMFLRLLFLEGKKRKKLFKENPLSQVWISSSRISCGRGDGKFGGNGGAVAFAWYIWSGGYKGPSRIDWFN